MSSRMKYCGLTLRQNNYRMHFHPPWMESTMGWGPGVSLVRVPVLEAHPSRDECDFFSVRTHLDASDVTWSAEFIKFAWRIYSADKATVHARGWKQSTTEREGLTLVFYGSPSSSQAKIISGTSAVLRPFVFPWYLDFLTAYFG